MITRRQLLKLSATVPLALLGACDNPPAPPPPVPKPEPKPEPQPASKPPPIPPATYSAEGLQIETRSLSAGVSLVLLDGAVDARTISTFRQALDALKNAGTRFYILNFEKVKYVNSTGFGYMINVAEAAEAAKGKVILVKVQKSIRQVIDMLALGTFFTMVESREEAEAACR